MKRTFIVINLLVCFFVFNANSQNCEVIVFEDDFSTPSNWTQIGSGDVNVAGGTCNFDNVLNGTYEKVLQGINSTLSDNYWSAEFKFSIQGPNPTGFGTGHILLALTAGTLDFMAYDISQSYLETTQDGIGVLIYSNSIYDNNIANWRFIVEDKKGNVRNWSTSSQIFADPLISDYYIRLERTSTSTTQLSVFSDPNFTIHLPGSPLVYSINPTITGLTTIQHSNSTPGAYERLLNATVDNDKICSYEIINDIDESSISTPITVFPNPANDHISLHLENSVLHHAAEVTLYDLSGKVVHSQSMKELTTIDISELAQGVFIIEVKNGNDTFRTKFIKQ